MGNKEGKEDKVRKDIAMVYHIKPAYAIRKD